MNPLHCTCRDGEVQCILKRLSSNLRPTTREYMHLVTHRYSRSRNEGGGHAIRSVIAEKTIIFCTQTSPLYVLQKRSYWRWDYQSAGTWSCLGTQFYVVGISTVDFFAVTLSLTQWPSHTNMTRIAWRYTRWANINFLHQVFRRTYRHIYRHTASTEITGHISQPDNHTVICRMYQQVWPTGNTPQYGWRGSCPIFA